ncbi:BTB/POZ domain-containing protein At2g46260-like isoform X2 [Triticum dicoccoides]|uniref:BTB/POZ domain-containing protein At2g46260-like isoform X2 n=1 Tax=Triticum dicoccoides TaxID=85692 RepID=UPI00188F06FA|nr:BTB/POZ domain-containing protein At2g46260-like isoform X2 [Triticum dicoccoides]
MVGEMKGTTSPPLVSLISATQQSLSPSSCASRPSSSLGLRPSAVVLPEVSGMAGAGAEEAVVGESFEFAFDKEAFSDKKLRVEVVGSDDAASRKRRREDDKSDEGECVDSSSIVMAAPTLRVTTMHINSAILAAKSPFFFKLFSNGMKESDKGQATLRIADSESAVLCLDLPYSISMAPALAVAAKKFFAERYKDFLSTKLQDELMRIPLAGILAILSRNDLGVLPEEAVYDFVLRWADSQYPNPEEKRKILSSQLLPLVPLVRSRVRTIVLD